MSASASGAVYYDPYKVEISANPYPVFKRLREEAPLYYNQEHDFYAVSRFADVESGLKDRETFISGKGAIVEIIKANAEFPPGVLIFEDPPIHTAHRGLLQRLFTPKRMVSLESKIRDYCAQCLDPLVGADGFDFIADLGAQMPIRVIGMLLGIPEKDHASVRDRVDASLRTEAGKPMDYVVANMSGEGFEDYIDWRMKNPSDDVMTELLTTPFKDEKGEMRCATREEVLTMVNVLAGAGNETTARLIGWTGKVLAEHPDQRAQIVQNPGLIPQAIEEILRFEPPAPHVARYVSRDIVIHGQTVPKGSAMMFLTGSANRDETRFANGDSFNINREARSHLTFGYGIHACVGSVLARLEGRVALEEILKRFPTWDVDMSTAVLSPTSTVRGWENMPAVLRKGNKVSVAVSAPVEAPKVEAAAPVTIEGKWSVTVKGPTGAESTILVLQRDGDALTGTQSGRDTTSTIMEAKFDGGTLTWVNQITKPMKMKLTFTGTVSGNTISGKVKAGFMGSFPFTGAKI
jgi:cytochrome P450